MVIYSRLSKEFKANTILHMPLRIDYVMHKSATQYLSFESSHNARFSFNSI